MQDRARRYAIVVAGGKGLRMGGDLPKQFVCLGAQPVLMHTLRLFAACDRLVLVLPREHIAYWQGLCRDYIFSLEHSIVEGGDTRYHSVLSGLRELERLGLIEGDLVAVHDGVRPFASAELIERCFEEARLSGAALPYLPMVDSLRQRVSPTEYRAVDRQDYCSVQTPQVFDALRLLAAYALGYQEAFTDDASVWEMAGNAPPRLVLGNTENIKLTTPLDLRLASLLIAP